MWGFWDQNKELVYENNILNREVWISIGVIETLTQMPLFRDVT